MPNSTLCATYSNCTILDGSTSNGTYWVTGYDAFAPVPYWHQRLELAIICIFNSLTFILIVARVGYRWYRLRRFRGDDRWMAVSGILLIAYTASQIATNKYGSGLYMKNVHTGWLEKHWHWSTGWAGYYIITSLIKISVCFTFLEILPHHLTALRYAVFGLIAVIASLGITLTCGWVFQCTPFLSNFVFSENATSCANYDIFRWTWVGLSLPIDFLLLAVPLHILKCIRMPGRERKILRLVFSANLLGTLTCILGIYGVYENRTSELNQGYYHEAIFIMMNDIEIFMYTLGASFPVMSRYLVRKADTSREIHSNFSAWARDVPDFFLPDQSVARPHRHSDPISSRSGSQISVKTISKKDGNDIEMSVRSQETPTPSMSEPV